MSSFSFMHWVIVAIIGFVFYAAVKSIVGSFKSSGSALFCTTCGHEGPTRIHTKGSLAIEIVLWLAFVVPGLIYSLWRLTTRAPVCSSCGAATLVPINSPVAVKMRGDLLKT